MILAHGIPDQAPQQEPTKTHAPSISAGRGVVAHPKCGGKCCQEIRQPED